MVLYNIFFLCITLGGAVSNDLSLGVTSETCMDEAANFLQMSGRAKGGTGHADSSMEVQVVHRKRNLTTITPVDCSAMNKPIQIMIGETGYQGKELNVSTGIYSPKFSIPFDKVPGGYQQMGGCGISPKDSIIYCAMHAGGSYIVRVDRVNGDIEFVARIPWFVPYNSADFSATGTFFVGTWYGEFLAIKDLDKATGFPPADRNNAGILDLRSKLRQKPPGMGHAADLVAVYADLAGNGPEEFIFVVYGAKLFIAKYDNATDKFTQTWSMFVRPSRGDFIYGAGWNFQNQLFFAVNNGQGVYEIPLDDFASFKDGAIIELELIGDTNIQLSNDGLSCITDPSPWATEMQSFDCASNPGPIMATRVGAGYDISSVDFTTGAATPLYNIPNTKTTPPFKMMNGFGIGPLDSVGYASLVMDDWNDAIYPTPPPFYVVRFDQSGIEFVAKVQAARGVPIAGCFDPDGNYYIISNPSLIKIPKVQKMKGYKSHLDKDLPIYDRDHVVHTIPNITGAKQIADIVAVKANFDGKGNATWIVGANVYQQLHVIKIGDTTEHFLLHTFDALGGAEMRQNFGSAWSVGGEIFFGSNDGLGAFKVPLDKIQVPGASSITLELAGKSPKSVENDGLSCIESSSVFWGKGLKALA